MDKQEILRQVDFGEQIAEEEGSALDRYFVETDNWRRVFDGEVDVIYGTKGSGKSALYSLLLTKANDLFDRNIVLIPGEKPRGTPAFSDIVGDPPATEKEFIGLWKLYFLSLLSTQFTDLGIAGPQTDHIRDALAAEGLVEARMNLSRMVKTVSEYVRGALRPKEVEGAIELDPLTQLPKSFKGKIVFGEPNAEGLKRGFETVDSLLEKANDALSNEGFTVWVLLDRLDVAFADNVELEQNALRALFRVYLDFLGYGNIKLKIFLRSDIWNRIIREGFREASHITRHVTISWNRASLLNLIVRRALYNEALNTFFNVEASAVLTSVRSQENFFFRMFPNQVDLGSRKPTTLDWMLSRTRDGTDTNAPRELVHFLKSLRAEQMRHFEIGETSPDGEALFLRQSFKDALPEVSRARLAKTLYAEYPEYRDSVELLRGEKTQQSTKSLASIWGVEESDAQTLADALSEVGLFQKSTSGEKQEYKVPFLYRDALDMVQGPAD